ncbi:flagellar motor protein MotS [Bacillus solimangrovi]|uniref:Flagellar motor protein MotS n=1 Tax=Bacillus solimangrovi TaxID=1305675 RepID=A0A1E5LCJ3_9BACI|nr:flagellar motor protein MotS [Bacillus solimangrovi]OEH91797.1 flagellar motor protein MotS [Bacillus solimangrovi]
MRRKNQQRQAKGAPKWMVTFSDMMMLILVFFVLLFSMSQIDAQKFRAVAESFNEKVIFDFYPSMIPMIDPASQEDETKQHIEEETNAGEGEQDQLGELLNEIESFLAENGMENVVAANRNERGVVLVLQEQVLFNTGEAVLLESAKPFLNKVGTLLTNVPNPVKVEGHTDNRPISTVRYPSNWELSGARSSSVIRYLLREHGLDAKRFTSIGYGDTRPLAANNSQENWQKNRRVEIVISDPTYSEENNY